MLVLTYILVTAIVWFAYWLTENVLKYIEINSTILNGFCTYHEKYLIIFAIHKIQKCRKKLSWWQVRVAVVLCYVYDGPFQDKEFKHLRGSLCIRGRDNFTWPRPITCRL